MLFTDKSPVDPDDSLVRKPLERFWENEISGALPLFETGNPKICPAFGLQDRHDSIILQLRLEVTVSRWFLPKSINLRFATFFNDLREACRFSR